jgi:hypothetical protein
MKSFFGCHLNWGQPAEILAYNAFAPAAVLSPPGSGIGK